MIMENLSLEEEYTIKDGRNRFRLKKELNYNAIKDGQGWVIFGVTNKLNTKVTPIKMKYYRLKNILIKLGYI